MADVSWVVASLVLSLPASFSQVSNKTENVQHSVLPELTVNETYAYWKGPGEQTFHVFEWIPYPPRHGGPMQVAKEWKDVVANESVDVIETKQFMGKEQRVLVTWLNRKDPERLIMIYAVGLQKEEFSKILATVKLTNQESSTVQPNRPPHPAPQAAEPDSLCGYATHEKSKGFIYKTKRWFKELFQ